jgi:hypothetical protein
MTRRNTENAAKADGAARQVQGAADLGSNDMLGMKGAIEAIHASSDDIARSSKPSTPSRSRPIFWH